MQTTTVTINNKQYTVITAESGFTFRRIHDGFVMGSEITLGNDFSTGTQRQDLPAYYEEILLTQSEQTIVEKVAALEQTTNDIIEVMNDNWLLS